MKKNKTAEKKPQTCFFENQKQAPKENLENQQEKQNRLISAILDGRRSSHTLGIVHDLIKSGAKLTQADKNGLFPLAAAVYSLNLKVVGEIEANLGEEVLEQWKQVDINIFHKHLNEQFPTELGPKPCLNDLGNWFTKYRGKVWCDIYDDLCNYLFHSWLHFKGWYDREKDLKERTDLVSLDGDYALPEACVVPEKIIRQHNHAFLEVKKYLDSFREEVESKVVRTENTLQF